MCHVSLTRVTLAYVTYQDIRSIRSLDEQTVIAIKAPPETRLEVPDPDKNIQIWLKSSKGPIEVYLCPEEVDDGTTENNSSSLGTLTSEEECSENLLISDDSASCDTFTSPTKDFIDHIKKEIEDPVTPKHQDIKIPIKTEHIKVEPGIGSSCLSSPIAGGSGGVKNALLEDQDISPDSLSNILPQTEDQDLDIPFIHLEAPLSMDDYLFSLDDGEGISDLFDAYDFNIPAV
ncbi:hypothetical protein FSP39_020420 [Pinctada imbricata]|uniref:E2F transcription factor CC-MB domain-containing protein n=1 Tax=Pinctada imbricata TaxID=66713 RepID=A0AA88XNF4_PINIB|nr:hypothetical protein FSP39_020420 [Pinctada imbricata]